MRQNQFLEHCCVFLIAYMLIFMMSGNAYAQESYTVEVGNWPVSVYPSLYYDGGQIMVPLRGLTEALGGIYLDMPMGNSQKSATLNEKTLLLITGMNVQLILPMRDYPEYTPGDSMDDYLQILLIAIMNGSIPMDSINYSIVEKNGDIYIPLAVFASAFDLHYSIHQNTISFVPSFITYGGPNLLTKSTVTFRLNIPNKVYDGKPLIWSEDTLEVFYNGERVTDYLPLSYNCLYTDMQATVHSLDGAPINAGTYLLTISTDSRDPQYTGTGYVSFIIEQAELTLTAKDKTIFAGSPLPAFSYEVSGIVPGDTQAKALTEDPILSIGTQDVSRPGAYEIEVSGGNCGNDYTIVERNNGILTVLPREGGQTIQIHCVERVSGRTIRTIEQQGTLGNILTISAPTLEGYLSDQLEQRVVVTADTVVTFYYDSIGTSREEAQTIQIRCVERASGRTMQTMEQQGAVGSILIISAPALEGYLPDQLEQQVLVTTDTVVTFYYDSISTGREEPVQEMHLPYINGYEDGMFRPESNIKRNECSVMLYRLLTEKVGDVGQASADWRFRDMHPNTWYDMEVCTLASRGIITGYQDGTFLPEHTVTRAEFVVMALRLAEIVPSAGGNRYKDVAQTHWAANYIRAASQYGLISGYPDGTFRPEQHITRAEAVTVLNKISGRTGCTLISEGVSFSDVPIGYWACKDIMLAANVCK